MTNLAEHLVAEMIQRHFLHRFEEIPLAVFLEHYVEERTPEGRLGRKATWDRLSFHSWALRRVWLSGQERIVFGEPEMRTLPDVEHGNAVCRFAFREIEEIVTRRPSPLSRCLFDVHE